MSTKERILFSARKHFLAQGFQAAAIRNIASDAGVTYGALYGYFDSKEALFYALTDPLVDRIMEKLDGIERAMAALPKGRRLFEMNGIFLSRIPELVELIFEDREVIEMILRGAKGTKYENFLQELVARDARALSKAAANAGGQDIKMFDRHTLEVLLEGYMAAMFHLILTGRDKKTVIRGLSLLGEVYEAGMMALIK